MLPTDLNKHILDVNFNVESELSNDGGDYELGNQENINPLERRNSMKPIYKPQYLNAIIRDEVTPNHGRTLTHKVSVADIAQKFGTQVRKMSSSSGSSTPSGNGNGSGNGSPQLQQSEFEKGEGGGGGGGEGELQGQPEARPQIQTLPQHKPRFNLNRDSKRISKLTGFKNLQEISNDNDNVGDNIGNGNGICSNVPIFDTHSIPNATIHSAPTSSTISTSKPSVAQPAAQPAAPPPPPTETYSDYNPTNAHSNIQPIPTRSQSKTSNQIQPEHSFPPIQSHIDDYNLPRNFSPSPKPPRPLSYPSHNRSLSYISPPERRGSITSLNHRRNFSIDSMPYDIDSPTLRRQRKLQTPLTPNPNVGEVRARRISSLEYQRQRHESLLPRPKSSNNYYSPESPAARPRSSYSSYPPASASVSASDSPARSKSSQSNTRLEKAISSQSSPANTIPSISSPPVPPEPSNPVEAYRALALDYKLMQECLKLLEERVSLQEEYISRNPEISKQLNIPTPPASANTSPKANKKQALKQHQPPPPAPSLPLPSIQNPQHPQHQPQLALSKPISILNLFKTAFIISIIILTILFLLTSYIQSQEIITIEYLKQIGLEDSFKINYPFIDE